MPGLYSRLQEIIGEKIFRHKVVFDGDVVFKKHITAYAPVGNEPSAGTFHWRYESLVDLDPVDASWHEVDLSGIVPSGCKVVFLSAGIRDSAGAWMTVSVSDSSGGTAYLTGTTFYGANQMVRHSGPVPLSSARTFWYAASSATAEQVEILMHGYYT